MAGGCKKSFVCALGRLLGHQSNLICRSYFLNNNRRSVIVSLSLLVEKANYCQWAPIVFAPDCSRPAASSCKVARPMQLSQVFARETRRCMFGRPINYISFVVSSLPADCGLVSCRCSYSAMGWN